MSMDEVSRVCKGLKSSRTDIKFPELATMEAPHAEFEAHVVMERGLDAWIYTVNGHTVDGELIVVFANSPITAETIAQEGLADTIKGLRHYDANTGLQATVERRPANG